MKTDDRLLRLALRGNATFSLFSGLVLVIFNGAIRDLMGIEPSWLLPAVGGGLALFALDLIRTAAGPRIDARKAWAIVLMDAGWVAGSAGLVALGILTSTGHWIVVGVALVVADFALLQYAGLRRLARQAA